MSHKRILALIISAVLIISEIFTPAGANAAVRIRLNRRKVTLTAGKSVTLRLTGVSFGNRRHIRWSTNKGRIASVSSKGIVRARRKGRCYVYAGYRGRTYRCLVTVKSRNRSSSNNTADRVTASPKSTSSAVPVQSAVSSGTQSAQASAGSSSVPGSINTSDPGNMNTSVSGDQKSSESPGERQTPSPEASSDTDKTEVTPGPTAVPDTERTRETTGPVGTHDTEETSVTPDPAGTSDPEETLKTPDPAGTSDPYGTSETPGPTAASDTKRTEETPEPTSTAKAEEASGAVHSIPSSVSENTLAVGSMTVTLDEDISTVKQRLGTEVRSYKEPQGFTAYEYNPDGDYTNLLFVYEDEGKVVGMNTISPYANYSGMVYSGQKAADTGFSRDSTYDNASEYYTANADACVEAYAGVESVSGNTDVFGIRVYKKSYDRSIMHLASGNEYTKNLKAATYDGKDLYVSVNLGYEICDLLSAYRVCQEKSALQALYADTAGLEMTEKMAASGSETISSSETESVWQKVIEEGSGNEGADGGAKTLALKSFSADPMGVVTSLTQFDKNSGGSGDILISGDYDRITAGFVCDASESSYTYAAVFLWKARKGLLDD